MLGFPAALFVSACVPWLAEIKLDKREQPRESSHNMLGVHMTPASPAGYCIEPFGGACEFRADCVRVCAAVSRRIATVGNDMGPQTAGEVTALTAAPGPHREGKQQLSYAQLQATVRHLAEDLLARERSHQSTTGRGTGSLAASQPHVVICGGPDLHAVASLACLLLECVAVLCACRGHTS